VYRTSNTLSQNIRSKAAELLNRHLAAAIDLHAQVKQAHWNVRGPAFIAIHELLDKVAEAVEDYSDTIAERAGALGATAEGTIHVAVQRSFLEQYKLGVADERARAPYSRDCSTRQLRRLRPQGDRRGRGIRRPGHLRRLYRSVARHRLPALARRVTSLPVTDVRDTFRVGGSVVARTLMSSRTDKGLRTR